MTRHFLGWSEPALLPAARFLVDRYAGGDGAVRLDRSAVVVPGGRAGRRLKELLLEEASSRLLRLVPPRVLGPGELAELFYEPPHPFASPTLARRIWSASLRAAPREVLAAVFPDLPQAADLRGWELLARQIQALQREVAGGGHRFADVAAECGQPGDLLYDDGERWRALARVQAEYERRLRANGRCDPDLERIAAGQGGALSCERDVWLLGVTELPRAVARIIDRADSSIGVLVAAPYEEAEAFDALGCVRPEAWAHRPLPIAEEHLRVVDRPADQAAAVLDEISRVASTLELCDVTVGLTDESLVPYIEEWLEAGGLHVHYAGGAPASTMPVYRLLGAVADYLEGRTWESFAAMIRHPDVERWLHGRGAPAGVSDPAERADRYFEEHLPTVLAGPLPGPGSLPDALPTLRDTLERRLLRPFRGEAPLAAWPERIVQLVVEIYSGRTLTSGDGSTRRLLESLEYVRDAALRLHLLPESVSESCGAATALRLLLDELGEARIPDEPERAAVEVLGWLDLALDDAPVAIVAGVNEPRLPESVNAHSFLPDRLRSRLGLVDNAARYARDAYHLTAMIHTRRAVRCVTGRFTAAGDPLRPSRLLLAARGVELARRIRRFTDAAEGTGLPAAPLLSRAGSKSAFALPPVRRLTLEPPGEISVTAFRAILDDPYRFVLERHLGLRARHDESRELDGAAFGDLAHQVLRRFGRSPAIRSEIAVEIAGALDELLEEEAQRRFGRSSAPAVRLQIELLRLRLHALARWQGARTREGWEAVLVEGAPAGKVSTDPVDPLFTAPFDVDGEPIVLRGRIDRLDRHAGSGEWAVLDYKTGDSAESPHDTHRKKSGEWKDLQLPLYRHLVRALTTPDGARLVPASAELRLGYVLLCPELEQVGGQLAEWSEDDLMAADDAAREAVRLLRRGWVEFEPARIRTRPGDPLAPLLGRRQLVTAVEEDAAAESGP